MNRIFLICALPLGLAACGQTATRTASGSVPTAAERACLRDVKDLTNNPDSIVLGSEYSGAGTYVRIGVGENRAAWKCIAYSDGTTDGIEFIVGDEYRT